jgi:Flp pilus assembly protein TadD
MNLNRIEFQPFKKDWWQKNWPVLVFLAVLVIAVYFNSLNNEFLSDDAAISQNPDLNSFYYITYSRYNLRSILIYITNQLFGLNPAAYRISNILFHLGSAWIIYFLIQHFFSSPIPLFTASIFAVHPVLTEGVTWISGGPYSNGAFFVLLSFLYYILGIIPAAAIFFLVSLFFSEKVIGFPIILLLYELGFGNLKKNWKKLIPFFALSGIWLIRLLGLLGPRLAGLETNFNLEPGYNNPLVVIPVAITSYLELVFWPQRLTFYHSELNFSQAQLLIRQVLFLIYSGLIIFFSKKERRIAFWLVFPLILLSPTLTPFRIAWIVAERYLYPAALGFFVAMAFLINKIGGLVKNRRATYIIFALIITALSTRTIVRNRDWQNQDTLWLATAKYSPSSPQNHNNLGDMYSRHGEFDKAIAEFQTAIKLKPDYADAYNNLASAYNLTGQKDLAKEYYQKALLLNPRLWQTHLNLAALYFSQNKFDLTLSHLIKAIEINPNNAELYVNLGIVHYRLKQIPEAKQAWQKALSLDPQQPQAKQFLIELQ